MAKKVVYGKVSGCLYEGRRYRLGFDEYEIEASDLQQSYKGMYYNQPVHLIPTPKTASENIYVVIHLQKDEPIHQTVVSPVTLEHDYKPIDLTKVQNLQI